MNWFFCYIWSQEPDFCNEIWQTQFIRFRPVRYVTLFGDSWTSFWMISVSFIVLISFETFIFHSQDNRIIFFDSNSSELAIFRQNSSKSCALRNADWSIYIISNLSALQVVSGTKTHWFLWEIFNKTKRHRAWKQIFWEEPVLNCQKSITKSVNYLSYKWGWFHRISTS